MSVVAADAETAVGLPDVLTDAVTDGAECISFARVGAALTRISTPESAR
jgi:hypothetical protein